MAEFLADISALMQDPMQHQQAVDTAHEGNARWKIGGFVQLQQRLERIAVTNFAPGEVSSAQLAELTRWYVDLAEYRTFLTSLETQYKGNDLRRGQALEPPEAYDVRQPSAITPAIKVEGHLNIADAYLVGDAKSYASR